MKIERIKSVPISTGARLAIMIFRAGISLGHSNGGILEINRDNQVCA